MPKGVELSSNPTKLLPPAAKKPAPRPKPEGEQSFEHALKKARPKAKSAPAPKKAHGSAVGVDEKPQVTQDAPKTDDAPVNPTDTDQPADPGTEKTETHDASKKPASPESDEAAPVQHLDIPEQSVVVQKTDVDATQQVAEQLPVAVQTPDAPPQQVDHAAYEQPDVQNSGAQAVAKAAIESPDQAEATDLPEPSHVDKPAPRQAAIKLPKHLQTDDIGKTDEVPTQVDENLSIEPEVAQADEPVTKTVTPAVSKQQKNVLEDDAPAPEIGLVPKSALKLKQPSQPDDQVVPQAQSIPEVADDVEPHHDSAAPVTDAVSLLDAPAPKTASPVVAQAQAPAPQPPVQPEQDFVTANHDRIVTGVRTQLLPNGGTMQLRLDPPDLGPLQVNVRMIDGAMTASFETSSDQATRLLSHSLGQLKTALETQGVSVEKLHVEQSPKDQQSGSSDKENQRDSQQQQDGARRDQQRRELLNRMWQRLAVGRDPLDMVA